MRRKRRMSLERARDRAEWAARTRSFAAYTGFTDLPWNYVKNAGYITREMRQAWRREWNRRKLGLA